jgi:Fe2+/Zn2+ uptake regulation proteins
MKYSKQKDEILKLMRSGALNHPRAYEVFLAMKEILPNIGIATVYRNLNAFADAGLIRRISGSGEADRFDHRIDDHHHTICNICSRVEDFELTPEAEVSSMLQRELGFNALSHYYVVRGVCRQCK